MNAQEAFDAASKGGFNDLPAVFAICQKHDGYCVIDGLAVNTYHIRSVAREPMIQLDSSPRSE